MRRNCAVVLFIILLLCSCSTNKSYDYAEFSRSLTNDMTFYSQYEIVYKVDSKKGEIVIVSPFLSDSNKYLPEKIIKLHLGLQVTNPNLYKFVIWMDYQFGEIGENDVLRKTKLVHMSQELPEEFISIDLPYDTNIHSQIKLTVSVISNGRVLYKSSEALYKVGKENKKIEKGDLL